jgi:hypothetical protein
VTYPSQSALAQAYDKTMGTVAARLKNGWSPRQAVGLDMPPPRKGSIRVTCAGIEYPSVSVLAKRYGMAPNWASTRLGQGLSPEQVVGIEPIPKRTDVGNDGASLFGHIYKIHCATLGKSYIGLTIAESVQKRFKEHLKTANLGRNPLGLHYAIALYGLREFEIETIARVSFAELADAERRYIAQLDTLAPKGFNLHPGGQLGSLGGKFLEIEGRSFQSISDAARCYGLQNYLVLGRLSHEWTKEQAFGLAPPPVPTHWKAITIAGQMFPSARAAARHFNVDYHVAVARLKIGWTIDEAFGAVERAGGARSQSYSGLVFESKTFRSLNAACGEHGMPYSQVMYRIQMWSMDPVEALQSVLEQPWVTGDQSPEPIRITLKDGRSLTVKEACAQYNIPERRVRQRLAEAWTGEQILNLEPRNPVVVGNEVFFSLKDAANSHGVNPHSVSKRIHKGWTLEEALEIMPRDRSNKVEVTLVVNGVRCEFESLAAACRELGMKYQLVRGRMHDGWTLHRAFGLEEPLSDSQR